MLQSLNRLRYYSAKKTTRATIPQSTCNVLLHVAAIENDIATMKFLLRYGADANSTITSSIQLKRLVDLTTTKKSKRRIRKAVEATEESTIYMSSLYSDDSYSSTDSNPEQLFRPLYDECHHCRHDYYERRPTCLHVAVAQGKRDIVDLLLRYGADPNITMQGYYGNYSPLIIAIIYRRVAIATMLLMNGASTNLRYNDGKVALHYAVKANDYVLVKMLLLHGADVNIRTYLNVTPLHIACERKLYRIAELLLLNGADPNVRPYNGVTALTYAVVKGQYKMIELLLNYGANVDASLTRNDVFDEVMFLRMKESMRLRIVELLREQNIEVKAQDTGGIAKKNYREFFKSMWNKVTSKAKNCSIFKGKQTIYS